MSIQSRLITLKTFLFKYNLHKYFMALISTLAISSIKFDLLDTYLYDTQVRLSSKIGLKEYAKTQVVLIDITPATVKKFSGYPKFNDHIQMLTRLKDCLNCTIAYNVKKQKNELLNFDGTIADKYKFVNYINSQDNIYFMLDDMDLTGQGPALNPKISPPLSNLKFVSAPKTLDTKIDPRAPVSRRIILDYQNQNLFHYVIAKKYNPIISEQATINGKFIRSGTNQVYIDFYPENSFVNYDFNDIHSGNFDIALFKNSILIIGDNTFSTIEDYSESPFITAGKNLITTSELHANMFQTLINNSAPKKLPKAINLLITFVVATITIFVALSSKPSRGIFLLLLTFLSVSIFSVVSLSKFNIWLDLTHPLLTIFLCYYFFIPYRLIIENRRSWEYIQKNKLLQQVEELKTNFISMMSHDLKTPIARIQGMTEVILKDHVPLSHMQREAVDTIKSSSDDLLKFINSILQYGRIESQGVELHKQSKDINQLLQEVIKKHEFLAKVKKIKLETEFEPMFPVQIDVELMKQVFSNLIENAIKYSPDESTVKVKSREEGSQVLVEVVDHGMGIPAEDLPNIFMKFYRSQSVKTSTIKGSGLGLYLAQYFTQLHNGEIAVTSEPGQGSCFTVKLPT